MADTSLHNKIALVTGGGTAACVESTVRHGLSLDYDIFVVSDCCGGTVQDQEQALKRMHSQGATAVSSEEILATLDELTADRGTA